MREKRFRHSEGLNIEDYSRDDSKQRRGGGRGHGRGGGRGAQTFRRGRAIEFLNRLQVKRTTLKQQLETTELQTINAILVGELKAIDGVINEFTQLFELYEDETNLKESNTSEIATNKD
ncbi:hypothetical protein ACIQZG_18730 [Lysinibacillus sp. NPDC096418]|uniref:hypothetical protein n=1 Tax=Lysinibacillus sp. NPDC096418 TaxID=3364138 RepID=UPI003802D69A